MSKDARKLDYINELELSRDEDAPMTLAVDKQVRYRLEQHFEGYELMRQSKQLVTGINASESSIRSGKNEQCRIFSFVDSKWV